MQTRLWPDRRTPQSPDFRLGISETARPVAALAAVLLAAALAPPPAHAVICAADAVPAATLLLPYFEVDLDHPNGLTTLFSIDNASATAVLAHATVWSDLAVPVFSFNVYLTGYDVQSLNLRDLLVDGTLPRTATNGQDPLDAISPKGSGSQDINFASCGGLLPPPPLPPDFLSYLQNALTGLPSQLAKGLCLGRFLGDRIARGYVTVDTVNNCTLRNPGETGYFTGLPTDPLPIPADVTDQNVLWGAWYIVDSAHDFAQGSTLVAIEASAGNPATSTAGRYTFYGRLVGWTGADHREPLATNFAVPFAVGAAFEGAADLIVWRDPKVVQAPFPCQAPLGTVTTDSWYPLGQEAVAIVNEEEDLETPAVVPIFPQPPPFVPLAAATQRVRLGGSDFPLPFAFGWLDLDLNLNLRGVDSNPVSDPAARQAWVLAVQSSNGHFATAADAFRLDSACAPIHPQL